MGATDRPPGAAVRVDSVRCLVAAVEELDADEVLDAVLTGEKCDMAEPGRAGRFLVVTAFF